MPKVVNLDAAQAALQQHFLGWQCRLRQLSIRQAGGRPTVGMRPTLILEHNNQTRAWQITVLINRIEPEDITAQLRHIALKTQDPADRYDGALKFLAAAYYQHPEQFSDRLTALFGAAADVVEPLLEAANCRLEFSQYQQSYRLPCAVRRLTKQEASYQATYWHNRLFNASLPGDVQIVEFRPDWLYAEANPPVPHS